LERLPRDASERRLEIPLQARHQGAVARQFVVKRQRVQTIMMIAEVKQPQLRLGPALEKAVAHVKVLLPKIVSGKIRRIAPIGLLRPDGVALGEETAAEVAGRLEGQLMKRT